MEPNPPPPDPLINPPPSPKPNHGLLIFLGFLFLVLLMGILFWYIFRSRLFNFFPPTSTPTVLTPTPTLAQPNLTLLSAYPDTYSLLVTASDSGSLITVSKLSSPDTLWSLTIPDLYSDHYHPLEFHHGYLYAIRRLNFDGGNNPNWTDELWRYGVDHSQFKLFSTRGLDFRTSPDNLHVAIKTQNTQKIDQLNIINFQGVSQKQFSVESLSTDTDEFLAINLLSWSDNSTFRGDLAFTAYPIELFLIHLPDYTLNRYPYPEGGYSFILNPANLWTAYTTMPILFDANSSDEYFATNPTIYLKLYDFSTQTSRDVAQAKAAIFTYEWSSETNLAYHTDLDPTPKEYLLK